MPIKIAFIGAGSIGFTRRLVADLLTVPEFANVEFAFTDINARNLNMVAEICRRDIEANGLKTRITATTSRRAALKDAKYVFVVVRIGGEAPYPFLERIGVRIVKKEIQLEQPADSKAGAHA